MIKLLNILNEITVQQPIPVKFKTNDELAYHLDKNQLFKKQLIQAIQNSSELAHNVGAEGWDEVINGWYNAEIIQHTSLNDQDEIMLDDGMDNYLYISIHPMRDDPSFNNYEIKLGNKTFYWSM